MNWSIENSIKIINGHFNIRIFLYVFFIAMGFLFIVFLI